MGYDLQGWLFPGQHPSRLPSSGTLSKLVNVSWSCPKARLPVQGWHRSAKGDGVGRTAASERGWGPCLVTVGWAGAGFFSSTHQICPIFQCLLGCTPWRSHGHLGVGCSPGTTRSRDPSHHGISDLGIKPRTTRFPAATTSPGNSRDLQRASAPGGASGKHLSMGGDPSHKPRVR